MNVAVLFRGRLRTDEQTKERIDLVVKCILDSFPEADIFCHMWDFEDIKNRLSPYTSEDRILVEKNEIYSNEISQMIEKTKKNYPRAPMDSRLFGQISSSVSLMRVGELFKRVKSKHYDAVFITRPDLIFLDKISFEKLENGIGYVNKHGIYISGGDYSFMFTEDDAYKFFGLYNFYKSNTDTFYPNCHEWYYLYLTRNCRINISGLNLDVGKNCEIYSHIKEYPEIMEKIRVKYNLEKIP